MMTRLIIAITLCGATTLHAAEPAQRTLFDFKGDGAATQWSAVNDGVMGGKSDGRFKITEAGTMEFSGVLSLENNGGFASVRSRGAKLKLKEGEAIVVRVRGDGRKYNLNLYTPDRRIAYSYRASFQTKKGEWIEVTIPLKDFVATWFGRLLPNQKLNPAIASGIGILLGDKKAGPFKLEIDWIQATGAAKANAN